MDTLESLNDSVWERKYHGGVHSEVSAEGCTGLAPVSRGGVPDVGAAGVGSRKGAEGFRSLRGDNVGRRRGFDNRKRRSRATVEPDQRSRRRATSRIRCNDIARPSSAAAWKADSPSASIASFRYRSCTLVTVT